MKVSFEEKHVKWGLTAFIVVLCSIIVFFAIYRLEHVGDILTVLISILTPFIYGLVMAYLLCPIYNFTVRGMYSLINRSNRGFSKALTFSKALGTIVSIIAMIVIVAGILWMIIPGLVESIVKIIKILPSSMESLKDWLDIKLSNMPGAKTVLDGWINNFTQNAINFVTQTVLPEYSSIATRISEGVLGALNVIKNFFWQ